MLMQNYQKINGKIAFLLTFALLFLLASTALNLVQQILQQDVTTNPFTNAIVNPPTNSQILKLPTHLFGKLNSPTKAYKHVKKTRLNLVLIGILKQENYALAIIKHNSKEKIYKINDAINATASVKAIYSKYIIINHNGNDEKLSIKYKTGFKKQANKQAKAVEQVKTKVVGVKETTKEPSLGKILAIKPRDKSKLKKILSSPKSMLSAVEIQPNYKNDDLHGFVVYPGKEKALFKKIGLESGDVVLTINGIMLDGWLKLISLRKQMSGESFDLVVERKNKQHFLSINLN